MEHLLHYLWSHRILPLRPLFTTCGRSVEVIDPGLHNSCSGPDFFNAKVMINGTLWVGNVEIHQNSSDWRRHGHDNDPAYDNVILHVVGVADQEIHRTNGEIIPQLVLTCPEHVREHYKTLVEAERTPACSAIIPKLQKLTIHSWMSALGVERLEHKRETICKILKRNNNDWEAALFTLIARYMGVGLNGDVFQSWGERLSMRAAVKIRNDIKQLEALFFGTAGLLDNPINDPYMMTLAQEYNYQNRLYNLPTPIEKSRWKMFRLRPDSFPYVRIAQLADLFSRQEGLFSKIIEAKNIKELQKLLDCSASEYWDSHYKFGQESTPRIKQLGHSTRKTLIINGVIPMVYGYGRYRGDEGLCCRAIDLLEGLEPEDNFIIREWGDAGIGAASAADSQALIELRRGYCERRRCLFCRFGYEFLRRR